MDLSRRLQVLFLVEWFDTRHTGDGGMREFPLSCGLHTLRGAHHIMETSDSPGGELSGAVGRLDIAADEVMDAFREVTRSLRYLADTFRLAPDLPVRQLVMLVLVANRGPLSVGALAAHAGVSRPLASHLVDHLVERGLVGRSEDRADRRRTLVRLMPDGEALVQEVYRHECCDLRPYLQMLSAPQLRVLIDGLRAVAAAASAERSA